MEGVEGFEKLCMDRVEVLRERLAGEHGWEPSLRALAKIRLEGGGAPHGSTLGDVARLGPDHVSARARAKLKDPRWAKAALRALTSQGLGVKVDGSDLVISTKNDTRVRAAARARREMDAAIESMRAARRQARKSPPAGLVDAKFEQRLGEALKCFEERAREVAKANSRF
jgi:hypothetical protein